MKKNLFLRLCLMMVVVLSIYSCRTDQFPEKETYNNTSAFQLTSKRISLTEAKHKAKLLPEIEKAETEFKKLKTNAFGKTVNYGNGVSIDTESVIFIENGPNYHTYTFNVISENTSADAPLENLLLTPLPDGTYKKLLISYNFTEQEKQIINSGGYVNTKGKSKVTDLGKGTLDDIVSKSQSCGYVEAQAYTICSEGVHFHGESNCNADVRSQLITVYLWKCESIDDGSGTSGGGPSSGSGPGEGGGGTTPTEPCNGNGILTGPLDPTTDIGDGTCTGVPTLPNPGLPLTEDPCIKTKRSITAANDLLHKPTVQTQMDAVLKGKTPNPHEFGLKIGDSGNSNYTFSNLVEGTETYVDMDEATLPAGSDYIGDGHSHATKRGKPSAGDFYGMIEELFTNSNFKYRFVYGDSDLGTDEVYALVLNDRNLALQFRTAYPESENYDINTHDFLIGSKLGDIVYEVKTLYDETTTLNTSGEDYHSKAVAMSYILDKFNIGISIAKVDTNGNLKKINVVLEEVTNPDGTKGKRLKVSKCP